MYLTVCPPRGPGHDNSVGEWVHLTVCPPRGPGSIPMLPLRSISRDFSLADDTPPTRPEPARQRMSQSPVNDTTQPADIEEEKRPQLLSLASHQNMSTRRMVPKVKLVI